MKKPAKTGLLTATLVLVGASLAACGGGGAPTDASEDEFCKELNSLFSDLGSMAGTSQKEATASIKSWATDLEKVGTPKDMPDKARDGFELMIKEVGNLDENATSEDFTNLNEDLSAGEEAASSAFEKYSTDTCGAPELPELPEIPSS
ncbi:hypothetical protein [Nocardioides sp.]|uniref:hypothetical protein n=1 Tax=Nocardioides sp. TaxID=35761 RepID=UPI00286DAD21|nr:hypothetical protein [Nocardioides sp.]